MPSPSGTFSFGAAVHEHRGMIFPLACVSLLLVLLVPLPPAVLDLLLVLNLTLSIIVLVTTIYVQSPRELSVFPSLLLSIQPDLDAASIRKLLLMDGKTANGQSQVNAALAVRALQSSLHHAGSP